MIGHGFDLEKGPTEAPLPPHRSSSGDGHDADVGAGADSRGLVWNIFCDGRLFYALSAAISAAALFFIYNPAFGSRHRVWFWEALRDPGGGIALRWTQDAAFVTILLALSLAYLAAALIGRSRGRGLFALVWVAVAFVAFTESREALRYYLPTVLIGASTGALLYAGWRGKSAVRVVILTTGLLGAYLFLPMPEAEQIGAFPTEKSGGYRCIAIGVVKGYTQRDDYRTEDGEEVGLVEHAWVWLRSWLPQHAMLLLFLFGVLWLLGLRGRSMPLSAAIVALLFVIGLSWVGYLLGVDAKDFHDEEWSDVEAGLHFLGSQWSGRFLTSVLALGAAMADLAAPRN